MMTSQVTKYSYIKKYSNAITFRSKCIAAILGIAFLLSFFWNTGALAGNKMERAEYEIKAVYIYNFILFTEWSETRESTSSEEGNITIGILGRDPFGNYFSEVAGKTIKSKGKKLSINRYGPYTPKTDLKSCDLLFISASERTNIKKILKSLDNSSVLTVSDMEGFLESGGMVQLLTQKGKIRWAINNTSIKTTGLRLSAQIFQSAVRIVKNHEDRQR